MAPHEPWTGRRLLVIGDVLLDRYLHGRVERISPEAPVPVVRLEGEEERPGGAANVAANILALGGQVDLLSVIGDDDAGQRLRRWCADSGIDPAGLRIDPRRPTPVKTRVLSRHQQMIRLDQEDDRPLDGEIGAWLGAAAERRLEKADGVIVSDYAKGVIGADSLGSILRRARQRSLPVVVDPKIRNFDTYQPATVVTPNQAEAAAAAGCEIRGDGDARAAAGRILQRLDVEAVLVTRGEHGMLLVPRRGAPTTIPARAREVFDVTGAGDTVAAVLGIALAAGEELARAARLANAAAALAVGRLGTAVVAAGELDALGEDDQDGR
ncbi:MAG: D-glycero-beta-D-manno-heptose-7-phosphate kinase [Acidobacteriota bacterium]|nr:D-glycero-beta-D-manno-heptose-7-phosphate kinase [Acidobacteriota bacterium]